MIDSTTPLHGLGILYFGNDWRSENRTSSHHIAVRLAKVMPVIYVASPGIRAPQASRQDLGRIWRKLRAAIARPRQIEDNLWLCTIPQIPFRRVPGVNILNRVFSTWAVRRAIRFAGLSRWISWFVVPHPGFLAQQLDEELCVYYCTDDYSSHPGVDRHRISELDALLTRAADLVFVAPPALVSSKKAINANVRFSPHGVDVDLFSKASDPRLEVPGVAAALPHPVVGYFGSLHEWIDLDLIAWLAQQRPLWSFLLIGHAAVDVSKLSALPNVCLAGPQPYESLPNWAKAFDAAIIPYVLNRQIENANPLKLREYLATGKPIVSVSNPEIDKFAAWVKIARDRQGFLVALEEVIHNDTPSARDERIKSIAGQTWDKRVAEILDATLASLVARRQQQSTRKSD